MARGSFLNRWSKVIASQPSGAKRSKYRAISTVVDGIRFDSKREADMWRWLAHQQHCAVIIDLTRQVPFELHVNGEKVARYVADFTWIDKDTGEYVVADVKSPMTRKLPAYRLKRKMFRAEYGFDIREL